MKVTSHPVDWQKQPVATSYGVPLGTGARRGIVRFGKALERLGK